MSRIHVSLIQSYFTRGEHGNAEAVIVEDRELWHWFREDSAPGMPWIRAHRITGDNDNVAGPGCIIQSDFKSSNGNHGNFEVVVPLSDPVTGRTMLWHFFHDNSDVSLPWTRAHHITGDNDNVAGPGCIIQSDFKSGNGNHGNFEVVVPLSDPVTGRTMLWHFFHDNSDVSLPWTRAHHITGDNDNVAGPGCIIQSDFKSGNGNHGNFEVVVPLSDPVTGRTMLWHFFHDNSDVSLPWTRAHHITGDNDNVAGPGCIIQSDFKSGNGNHGNFEVVVPLRVPNGGIELRHFFHDNSDISLPWQKAQFITQSCAGWACITRSDYGPAPHRNYEVLVDECGEAVVHYWHPNDNIGFPWLRSDRFTMLRPRQQLAQPAQKVVQITGEYDREGCNGTGKPKFAFNQTESRYGIIGCDLGVSFEHHNRLYVAFGDTWRVGHGNPNDDLDSIAFSTDTNIDNGMHLTFFKQPPLVPGIRQDGYNVPLEGFSSGKSIFMLFSTDHYRAQGRDLMGRSVMARSDNDGLDYVQLYELSYYKFINVSGEIVDAQRHGLPGQGAVMALFGSGRYRSSDVYLAVKPAATIGNAGSMLFYAGSGPRWSNKEEDATPLFCEGGVGELSVRWNEAWGAWLCLYSDDTPTNGIVGRWAPRPFGPWSDARIIFASADGYGRFIHQPGRDHVQEGFGTDRSNDWGAVYGPYQIPQHARRVANGTKIFFTMSVWNPYQTMLMTTTLPNDRW